MAFTYGWCSYCTSFTYHDLREGACGDCWYRWRKYPETMPPQIRRAEERSKSER